MFGCVKMTQRKLTALSAMCFIIFLGVCVLMLRAAAPDTVELNGDAYSLIAEDEDDAARFLEAAGYEVGELVSDSEITVPKTWNSVYTAYNELQLSQGLDLTPYKGRPARRLVYSVDDSGSYAELLISDSRIIAAHLSSMEYDDSLKRLIG